MPIIIDDYDLTSPTKYRDKIEKKLISMSFRENECLIWKGQVRKNFPHGICSITICKNVWKKLQAHRVAYMVWKGHIPENTFVLHKCDNPRCIEPSHLHLGSQKDNMREMRERNRAKDETRGRKGERHPKCKLSNEQIKEIRILRKQGVYGTQLSKIYGVSNPMIYYICNMKNWKHIEE